ncbi:hypothetical protein HNR48_002038 [Pseudoteredinibacter isoporae]|uniref:Integrase DNA-binding domain-containing protein n=1 Tax=Pseudoteredinibacter isoporae TaxID=570281 RepID=A0A7X0JU52_9GAMM|nr:hypothetical protein [Pseudoteredinibacter isoporae]
MHLYVRPSGAKVWRAKYRLAGKEQLATLGGYPAVTLSDARKELLKLKTKLAQGEIP